MTPGIILSTETDRRWPLPFKAPDGPGKGTKAMDYREEMKQPREELNENAYRYYVLDEPTMSDYDYDMKNRRLQRLGRSTRRRSPWILPHSGWATN